MEDKTKPDETKAEEFARLMQEEIEARGLDAPGHIVICGIG